MTAIELISAERQRQQSALGWNREHDDQHKDHAIAINAAHCLLHGTDCSISDWRRDERPDWGLDEKHKSDRVKQLTIAGALVAAELDRVLRSAK